MDRYPVAAYQAHCEQGVSAGGTEQLSVHPERSRIGNKKHPSRTVVWPSQAPSH